jgi:hypothetical protein
MSKCYLPHDVLLAVAQDLQAQVRFPEGNIGLAVATIILNARLGAELGGVLTPEQLSGLKRRLRSLELLDAAPRAAVGMSFADAFRYHILVCLAMACGDFFDSAILWQRRPRTFRDLKRGGG